MSVAERLEIVRREIVAAAASSGRDPSAIRLVAVSKTKPPELIREAYAAGQRDFGENYVQELSAKADALADLPDLRFHLIGHLQRNKAKLVARLVSVIHTIDSARLATELGKHAGDRAPDRALDALVEVNVGGEEQKSGCRPEDLPGVLAAVEAEPALRLRGLMTVPPFTEDPRASAPYFEELARLRQAHGGPARLPELSMGMSRDFPLAIAAGATLVRIGTAIFGSR